MLPNMKTQLKRTYLSHPCRRKPLYLSLRSALSFSVVVAFLTTSSVPALALRQVGLEEANPKTRQEFFNRLEVANKGNLPGGVWQPAAGGQEEGMFDEVKQLLAAEGMLNDSGTGNLRTIDGLVEFVASTPNELGLRVLGASDRYSFQLGDVPPPYTSDEDAGERGLVAYHDDAYSDSDVTLTAKRSAEEGRFVTGLSYVDSSERPALIIALDIPPNQLPQTALEVKARSSRTQPADQAKTLTILYQGTSAAARVDNLRLETVPQEDGDPEPTPDPDAPDWGTPEWAQQTVGDALQEVLGELGEENLDDVLHFIDAVSYKQYPVLRALDGMDPRIALEARYGSAGFDIPPLIQERENLVRIVYHTPASVDAMKQTEVVGGASGRGVEVVLPNEDELAASAENLEGWLATFFLRADPDGDLWIDTERVEEIALALEVLSDTEQEEGDALEWTGVVEALRGKPRLRTALIYSIGNPGTPWTIRAEPGPSIVERFAVYSKTDVRYQVTFDDTGEIAHVREMPITEAGQEEGPVLTLETDERVDIRVGRGVVELTTEYTHRRANYDTQNVHGPTLKLSAQGNDAVFFVEGTLQSVRADEGPEGLHRFANKCIGDVQELLTDDTARFPGCVIPGHTFFLFPLADAVGMTQGVSAENMSVDLFRALAPVTLTVLGEMERSQANRYRGVRFQLTGGGRDNHAAKLHVNGKLLGQSEDHNLSENAVLSFKKVDKEAAGLEEDEVGSARGFLERTIQDAFADTGLGTVVHVIGTGALKRYPLLAELEGIHPYVKMEPKRVLLDWFMRNAAAWRPAMSTVVYHTAGEGLNSKEQSSLERAAERARIRKRRYPTPEQVAGSNKGLEAFLGIFFERFNTHPARAVAAGDDMLEELVEALKILERAGLEEGLLRWDQVVSTLLDYPKLRTIRLVEADGNSSEIRRKHIEKVDAPIRRLISMMSDWAQYRVTVSDDGRVATVTRVRTPGAGQEEIQELLGKLDDGVSANRIAALRTLGQLRLESAAAEVVPVLERLSGREGNPNVQAWVAWALKNFGKAVGPRLTDAEAVTLIPATGFDLAYVEIAQGGSSRQEEGIRLPWAWVMHLLGTEPDGLVISQGVRGQAWRFKEIKDPFNPRFVIEAPDGSRVRIDPEEKSGVSRPLPLSVRWVADEEGRPVWLDFYSAESPIYLKITQLRQMQVLAGQEEGSEILTWREVLPKFWWTKPNLHTIHLRYADESKNRTLTKDMEGEPATQYMASKFVLHVDTKVKGFTLSFNEDKTVATVTEAGAGQEEGFTQTAQEFEAFLLAEEKRFMRYHGTAWRAFQTKRRADETQKDETGAQSQAFIESRRQQQRLNIRFITKVGMTFEEGLSRLDAVRAGEAFGLGELVYAAGGIAEASLGQIREQVERFSGAAGAETLLYDVLDLSSHAIDIEEYLQWRQELSESLQGWGRRLMRENDPPKLEGWPEGAIRPAEFKTVINFFVAFLFELLKDKVGKGPFNFDWEEAVSGFHDYLVAKKAGVADLLLVPGVSDGVKDRVVSHMELLFMLDAAERPQKAEELAVALTARARHFGDVTGAIERLVRAGELNADTEPDEAARRILENIAAQEAPPVQIDEPTRREMARRAFDLMRQPLTGLEEKAVVPEMPLSTRDILTDHSMSALGVRYFPAQDYPAHYRGVVVLETALHPKEERRVRRPELNDGSVWGITQMAPEEGWKKLRIGEVASLLPKLVPGWRFRKTADPDMVFSFLSVRSGTDQLELEYGAGRESVSRASRSSAHFSLMQMAASGEWEYWQPPAAGQEEGFVALAEQLVAHGVAVADDRSDGHHYLTLDELVSIRAEERLLSIKITREQLGPARMLGRTTFLLADGFSYPEDDDGSAAPIGRRIQATVSPEEGKHTTILRVFNDDADQPFVAGLGYDPSGHVLTVTLDVPESEIEQSEVQVLARPVLRADTETDETVTVRLVSAQAAGQEEGFVALAEQLVAHGVAMTDGRFTGHHYLTLDELVSICAKKDMLSINVVRGPEPQRSHDAVTLGLIDCFRYAADDRRAEGLPIGREAIAFFVGTDDQRNGIYLGSKDDPSQRIVTGLDYNPHAHILTVTLDVPESEIEQSEVRVLARPVLRADTEADEMVTVRLVSAQAAGQEEVERITSETSLTTQDFVVHTSGKRYVPDRDYPPSYTGFVELHPEGDGDGVPVLRSVLNNVWLWEGIIKGGAAAGQEGGVGSWTAEEVAGILERAGDLTNVTVHPLSGDSKTLTQQDAQRAGRSIAHHVGTFLGPESSRLYRVSVDAEVRQATVQEIIVRAPADWHEDRVLEALKQPEATTGLEEHGVAEVPGGFVVDPAYAPAPETLVLQKGVRPPADLPKTISPILANETTVAGMIDHLNRLALKGDFYLAYSLEYFDLSDARAATPADGRVKGSVLLDPKRGFTARQLGAAFLVSERTGTVYVIEITEITHPTLNKPLIYVRMA